MKYLLKVTVALKDGIFDPQGEGVRKTLFDMGFTQAERVRMQKKIEILLDAEGMEEAEKLGRQIAEKVLVNPVLETYTCKICEKEGRER